MKIGHFIRLPRTRLDLSPLISIGLVAVVALAAVFLSRALQHGSIPLPTQWGDLPKGGLLVLQVRADGCVLFDGKRVVEPDRLKTEIAGFLVNSPQASVTVVGEVDSRWADVVRVLDVARSAGIENPGLSFYPVRASPSTGLPR
jgi:biopolymer transport protein ExbD